MPDFPIDPELRIRGSPPRVLRRATEAMAFIQKMILSRSGRAWRDVQQSFEEASDEWSAMEAVVKLELLLVSAEARLVPTTRPGLFLIAYHCLLPSVVGRKCHR
jgi:hypothetical protein